MGNDGGSIPKRRELVKEAARNPSASEIKEKRLEQADWNWTHDPLTQNRLADPIVSDAQGRLFNKEAVLEFLLMGADEQSKKAEQEKIIDGAITNIKDVVEVKFTSANDSKPSEPRWVCPITNKELGVSVKSVYIVPCGHAFSESAVKEVPSDKCLQCNESYAPNDIIPILSTVETDIARLSLRIKSLKERGISHSLKKTSKKRKQKPEGEPQLAKKAKVEIKGEKPSETSEQDSSISNNSTALLTTKVMREQEERNKKRKLENNKNLQSLFTKDKHDPSKGRNTDFMTRGFKIPVESER